MTALEERARGAIDEAEVALYQVERALATAHAVEVQVERSGAFVVRVGLVVLGVVVAGVTGFFLLRWFLRSPEPMTESPDTAPGAVPGAPEPGDPRDAGGVG